MITLLEWIDKTNPAKLQFKSSLSKKDIENIIPKGGISDYCQSNLVGGNVFYSNDNKFVSKQFGNIDNAKYYFNFLKNRGSKPTMLLHSVEKSAPYLNGLIASFSKSEKWRFSNITCSISDIGSSIGFHADMFEVMLLQVEGKRTWEFWKSENMSPEYISTLKRGKVIDAKPPLNSEPDYVFELFPGDILYIPPYWGHLGTTDDSTSSLSLSFSWIIFTPYILTSGIIEELSESDKAKIESTTDFFKPYFPISYNKEELDLYVHSIYKSTIGNQVTLDEIRAYTRISLELLTTGNGHL
jgi:ribosomal protein L16 Arg81 hydroxylase